MIGQSSPIRVLFVAALFLISGLAGCRLKPPPPTFPIDLKQVITKEHAYLTDFPNRIHSPGPHPRVIELAYKGETDLTPELTETVRIGSFAFR